MAILLPTEACAHYAIDPHPGEYVQVESDAQILGIVSVGTKLSLNVYNQRQALRFDTRNIAPVSARLVVSKASGNLLSSDLGVVSFFDSSNAEDAIDYDDLFDDMRGPPITGSVLEGQFDTDGELDILAIWRQTQFFNLGVVTSLDYDKTEPDGDYEYVFASDYPYIQYTKVSGGIGRVHAKHPAWIF